MKITIHLVCRKFDLLYEAALKEYFKRLSAFCDIHVKQYKNRQDLSCENLQKILSKDKSAAVFLIQAGGSTVSSTAFADEIETLRLTGFSRLDFFILPSPVSSPVPNQQKKPTGQNPRCLSLTTLSLSDELTAVVLSEQLYRAFTILNHITYHK